MPSPSLAGRDRRGRRRRQEPRRPDQPDLCRRRRQGRGPRNSDGTKAAADDTVRAITASGGDAFAVQGDLTQVAEVRRLFDDAIQRFGGVDIAINTAGKVLKKPIRRHDQKPNTTACSASTRRPRISLHPGSRQADERRREDRDGGHIAPGRVTGLYSTYAGAKAPVEHFTRAAAKEFGPRGISVTNVAPGPMDTPFFYPRNRPRRWRTHKSQRPQRRADEDRGHRADREIPGHRRLVDHRPDQSCQLGCYTTR